VVEEVAAVRQLKKIRVAQVATEEEDVSEDVVESEDVDLVIGEEEGEEEEEEGLVESDDEVIETMEDEEEDDDDDVVEVEVEPEAYHDEEEETAEPLEMEEDDSNIIPEPETQPEPEPEEIQLEVVEELIESETFASGAVSTNPTAAPSISAVRPPPREDRDRLPSFGRNTLAYEDGGDDGIVPSTPVLLRPRTNDGFAEAVSSPQVNTRFVFGAAAELSLPASANAASHLESQCMEDTRMDLSQLEESNSVRSVTSSSVTSIQVSSFTSETIPTGGSIMEAASMEEQGDFEGGPDLEGDADAEFDLLGEEEPESRELDPLCSASTLTSDPAAPEKEDHLSSATPIQFADVQGPSSSTQTGRLLVRRGSSPGARGRGDSRIPVNRPVPITWTPSPADTGTASSAAPRMIRRNPIAAPAPLAPGSAPVFPESGVNPPPRGRGGRGRATRSRGRRM